MTARKKNGQFEKGVSGNPRGRPKKSGEYLQAMMSTCTIDDWVAITGKAIKQAKAGDKFARQWLSDYIIGKAAPQAPEGEVVVLQDVQLRVVRSKDDAS